MILTIILVAVAAIFDAIKDTLYSHFSNSVFKNKPAKFWRADLSWQYAYRIPIIDYPIDAWHISKSIYIALMIFAMVFYNPLINVIVDFILLAIVHNLTFTLFYDKILYSPYNKKS